MISREKLAKIEKLAAEYVAPPQPRSGIETIALYERLSAEVMTNLPGLLVAARDGLG